MLVVDTLYQGDGGEDAERLRDPSHVRNYSEAEWRALLERAGLAIEEVRVFEVPIELEPWLARTECTGDDALRVRELLADRISDRFLAMRRIALRARH